jgi:hypothetical protein
VQLLDAVAQHSTDNHSIEFVNPSTRVHKSYQNGGCSVTDKFMSAVAKHQIPPELGLCQ